VRTAGPRRGQCPQKGQDAGTGAHGKGKAMEKLRRYVFELWSPGTHPGEKARVLEDRCETHAEGSTAGRRQGNHL